MKDVLEVLKKLPVECFVNISFTGGIAVVRRGVSGYFQVMDPHEGDTADSLNEKMGVTKAQREAMLVGSMFGWDTPGADPDIYDENGKLKKGALSTRRMSEIRR